MKRKSKIHIVHLLSIAGVSGLLVKLHRKWFSEHYTGYTAKVIARSASDYYGFNDVYKEYGTYIGGKKALWFYLYVSLYLFFKRPKIIQIHASITTLKMINKFKKYIFYKPYLIYHAHGGDIRGKGLEEWLLANCDQVIVSTEDLKTHPDFRMLNCPIDHDLFFPLYHNLEKNGKALFINNFLQYEPKGLLQEAKDFCARMQLDLTVIDRMSSLTKKIETQEEYMKIKKNQGEFIPYKEMGNFYRKFEYFLDFKGLTKVQGKKKIFSKSALEASYCGCKIAQEDGTIISPHQIREKLESGNVRFEIFYYYLWKNLTGSKSNEETYY